MSSNVSVPSPSRPRTNPLLRLFSSVWFGITLLTLILVYACVMSAVPGIRPAMEMTEMQAFRHWVFVGLCGLFCVTMMTVTWVRIRWNLTNAGVLTTHLGLLLLVVGGAAVYFKTKVEGDVLLISPTIYVVNMGKGGGDHVAQLLAETGQTWANRMPFFGGDVRIAVKGTAGEGLLPVTQATVSASVGGKATEVTLKSNGGAVPISDKLALQLVVTPPESNFYDDEAPTLHYAGMSGGKPVRGMARMEGLPLMRERFSPEGGPVADTSGHEVLSKRWRPEIRIAGVTIPTGWFENWRLPIALETPGLPFDVKVTGYLPYIAGMQELVVGGGKTENPGITVTLTAGNDAVTKSLLALSPQGSLVDVGFPLEFRWVKDEAERAVWTKSLAGMHELTVEVGEPAVTRTYAIAEGQTVQVEGTPYELTVTNLMPRWEMITGETKGAVSAVAAIHVSNGVKKYDRTVIERFPQLSQDVDEQGVRHREGPYDPNLKLTYRTSANGKFLFTAGPDLPVIATGFGMDGRAQSATLAAGKSQTVTFGGGQLGVVLESYERFARALAVPAVTPGDFRVPDQHRMKSAVRLELTGRGALAGWQETKWCKYSPYPEGGDANPIVVRTPPGEDFELTYSRMPIPLGAELAGRKLVVVAFPGGTSPERWRSVFNMRPVGGGPISEGIVETNATWAVANWTLFQSGAAGDQWSWTILGVGNRRGIWPMLVGSILIPLGACYAFYVKPILIRRRKKAALAAAEAKGVRPGRERKPEMAEATR